jgi:hypothetical protein
VTNPVDEAHGLSFLLDSPSARRVERYSAVHSMARSLGNSI